MDYYSILGVPKNASQDDIKKAYKKQSMKHHPDRGGNEAEFKKVNEAYQTLGDPQKRAEYDNPQPQFRFNSQDFNGHPFEDIFGGFGFGGRPRQRAKNRDIQIAYTIDLRDSYNGIGTTITYRMPSGKTETLDLRIPPGVKNGDVVRVQGYGDDSHPQLPRGDLLVRLRMRIPKGWDVDGFDLITSTRVSVFDLLLGTEVLIDTPEGKTINLKVPKGSQSGTTFSITGHGLPSQHGGHRGKIYVKVFSDIPKIDDEDLLNKIKDIKNSLAG
jgi:DnaJ-class molecular chaperone